MCLPRTECALPVWWLQRHVLEKQCAEAPGAELEGTVRKEAGQSGPAPAGAGGGGANTRGLGFPKTLRLLLCTASPKANSFPDHGSPFQLIPGAMNSERWG